MNFFSVAVLCIASITFSVGVYHLMLHFRLHERKVDLAFAVMCFVLAIYDVASAGLYSVSSVANGMVWQRLQFVALAATSILILWFVSEFIERKNRWLDYLFSGYFSVQIVVLALDYSALTIIPRSEGYSFAFLGLFPLTYYEGRLGVLTIAQSIAGLFLCMYVLVSMVQHYVRTKTSSKAESKPILIGIIILIVGVVNDTLVSERLVKSIYMIEYAYLGFVVCMGYSLSNRYLRMHKALKVVTENMRQLAAAVNAAAESIMITDPHGIIQYVNPAFEQMTGYANDEIVGRTPDIVNSGKHDRDFYEDMWRTIAAGKVWRGRFSNRKKDGSLFREDAVISPITDKNNKIVNYVAVKRDVTQEVALETQLRQSQKMEALGQMARGVAHDFTNMLAIIMGHTQLLSGEVGYDEVANEHLNMISDSTRRLSLLTGDLLAFAHQKPISLRAMELNKIIIGQQAMLQRALGADVQVDVHCTDQKLMAEVDPEHLEQVITHIVVNSREAMPEGGHITLETSCITLSKKESVQFQDAIREEDRIGGKFAVISISDTGCGMSEETCSHIFEPFFSTKGRGRSTGLGLSTAYGIVAQHNGHITVYSEPGHGTTFGIYIPMEDRYVEEATAVVTPVLPDVCREVLVVEDNSVIRRVLVKMLQELGCSVLEAENGEQAMDLFRDNRENIGLLISDVMMPGVGGIKLAEQLREINPGLKVIFASGFSKIHLKKMGVLSNGEALMCKPLNKSIVVKAITDVMAK